MHDERSRKHGLRVKDALRVQTWLPETPQNTNFVEWGVSVPEVGENTNFSDC